MSQKGGCRIRGVSENEITFSQTKPCSEFFCTTVVSQSGIKGDFRGFSSAFGYTTHQNPSEPRKATVRNWSRDLSPLSYSPLSMRCLQTRQLNVIQRIGTLFIDFAAHAPTFLGLMDTFISECNQRRSSGGRQPHGRDAICVLKVQGG